MSIEKRLLDYVKIDTKACKNSQEIPSSSGQADLASHLSEELKRIGLNKVTFKNGVLYGKIDGDPSIDVPSLGFVAHLDTYPMDDIGSIDPVIIDDFDIERLCAIIDKKYPESILNDLTEKQKHNRLMFSRGNTNLGADDKAGIAVIVSAVERIISNNVKTPDIYLAFVTDEEVGIGSERIDPSLYKADMSYVVDGKDLGEIIINEMKQFSCFLSATGSYGFLGDGPDVMVNSLEIINCFMNRFKLDRPTHKDGSDDLIIHFDSLEGNVCFSLLSCSILAYDEETLDSCVQELYSICDDINRYYGDKRIKVKRAHYGKYNDFSRNDNDEVVAVVRDAFRISEVNCNIIDFRGVTDAQILRAQGRAAVSIGIGCGGFHSIYEWVSITDLEQGVDVLSALMGMKVQTTH